MAELAEMRMEQSMIEYEQMRTLKLFSEDEIKDLIRKRTDFEYKLRKSQKILKDILQYIQFERNLMYLVKERQRTRKSEVKIEASIVKKIQKLYSLATSRFPNEERVWEENIIFYTRVPAIQGEVRQIFLRMIQHHGFNALVWLKFIKWERLCGNDPDKDKHVRRLILQAIQRHPTNISLCVELLNAVLTSEAPDEVRLEIARRSYTSCSEAFKNVDVHYHLAMLTESMQHECAGELQRQILDDMKPLYSKNPLFWHTIAERELNGLPTYRDENESAGVSTVRQRLINCVETYEKAVSELDNNPEIWSYYLDTMFEMNRELKQRQLPLRRRLLAQALQKSDESGHMNVRHYTMYVNLLCLANVNNEIIEEILKRAVTTHNQSVEIWRLYIQHYMQNDNGIENVTAAFKESCKQLTGNSGAASIWEDYIMFLREHPNQQNQAVKSAYEEVLLQQSAEFDRLKCDYVEWTHTNGGIHWSRQLYRRAFQLGQGTMDIVHKMYNFEEHETVPNMDEWRTNIELAVHHFGKTNPDVWLMLIEFEKLHGNPLNVSRVHINAKSTLKPHLFEIFMSKYANQ